MEDTLRYAQIDLARAGSGAENARTRLAIGRDSDAIPPVELTRFHF